MVEISSNNGTLADAIMKAIKANATHVHPGVIDGGGVVDALLEVTVRTLTSLPHDKAVEICHALPREMIDALEARRSAKLMRISQEEMSKIISTDDEVGQLILSLHLFVVDQFEAAHGDFDAFARCISTKFDAAAARRIFDELTANIDAIPHDVVRKAGIDPESLPIAEDLRTLN